MSDATLTILPDSIETRLHAIHCVTCGVAFGVPVALYVARAMDGGAVHCPNGHAIEVASLDRSNGDCVSQLGHAHREIVDLRLQLQRAERERIAALSVTPTTDAAALSKDEMKRRALILAGRVAMNAMRRKNCPRCGRDLKSSYLPMHFLRHHDDYVRRMSPEVFA